MDNGVKKRRIELTEPLNEEEVKINKWTNVPYSSNYYKLLEQRKKLPAWQARRNFVKLLKRNQVLLLVGETGSGKTTQISQFALESGISNNLMVGVTQPRRVAAISIARRVSEEMDVNMGDIVGYTIRFEDCTNNNTKLKFMTDGMLLKEAMMDKSLSNYGIIILDEAHERTISTDVLFGVIKDILTCRSDLKLVIMSATLDSKKFQLYFNNCDLLKIPGTIHPVEIYYTKAPESDYLKASIRTVLNIHYNQPKGDILLFLTGEDEIETAKLEIESAIKDREDRMSYSDHGEHGEVNGYDADNNPRPTSLVALPLYSSLPILQQQKVFEMLPDNCRKCVIATNIAETSITIDGIVYVIDPGFSKQKVYNPRTRVESLLISPISKASAKQRAGRAGRTKPGKCYRLYTELSYNNELIQQTYPEILRCNLTSIVLNLKKLGIDDLVHFDFIDPPAPETMMRALEELNYLNALNDDGDLTDVGNLMGEFPLDPQLSKVLVSSINYNTTSDILSIISMLSCNNVFLRPKDSAKQADLAKSKLAIQDGDHLTLLNTYNNFYAKHVQGNNIAKDYCNTNFINYKSISSAINIREQLLKIINKIKLIENVGQGKCGGSDEIIMTLLCGYFQQVAYRSINGNYLTIKNSQPVLLHPSTTLTSAPQWVIYHEYIQTTKHFIRTVTKIDGKWLINIAPNYFNTNDITNNEIKQAINRLYHK